MLMIVTHTSVVFCGGNRPNPMHSICEMALNTAQEYCTPTLAFCGIIVNCMSCMYTATYTCGDIHVHMYMYIYVITK